MFRISIIDLDNDRYLSEPIKEYKKAFDKVLKLKKEGFNLELIEIRNNRLIYYIVENDYVLIKTSNKPKRVYSNNPEYKKSMMIQEEYYKAILIYNQLARLYNKPLLEVPEVHYDIPLSTAIRKYLEIFESDVIKTFRQTFINVYKLALEYFEINESDKIDINDINTNWGVTKLIEKSGTFLEKYKIKNTFM